MSSRAIVAAFVLSGGCASAAEAVVIERSIAVPVDGGDYLFEAAIDPPSLQNVDYSQQHELLGRAITLRDVQRVTLAEFSVHSPDGDDLRWFIAAELRMRAPGEGTHTVASITEFPADSTSSVWQDDGDGATDITRLVTGGATSAWVELRGDSPPTDTDVRVDFGLLVHVR